MGRLRSGLVMLCPNFEYLPQSTTENGVQRRSSKSSSLSRHWISLHIQLCFGACNRMLSLWFKGCCQQSNQLFISWITYNHYHSILRLFLSNIITSGYVSSVCTISISPHYGFNYRKPHASKRVEVARWRSVWQTLVVLILKP